MHCLPSRNRNAGDRPHIGTVSAASDERDCVLAALPATADRRPRPERRCAAGAAPYAQHRNYRTVNYPDRRPARQRGGDVFGDGRDRRGWTRTRNGRPAMRPISFAIRAASMLAVVFPGLVLAQDYGQATVNPMLLAEQDLAAESRGDVRAALALYRD